MTSEAIEDEERKRTPWLHQCIQRHKAKLGFIFGAGLITTVYYVPPQYTEVSCNDPSIRKPYYQDTISVRVLLFVCLPLPFIGITIMEWFVPPVGMQRDHSFRWCLRKSWHYTGDLLVGGLLMFFFNDLAKIATSEARPSFWSLCAPIITEEQCHQPYARIYWKDCTNPYNVSERKLADSMKSFPSGHSSVGVYSSIFMILYIQQRLRYNSHQLVIRSLQLMWVVWALMCCISRILDNKHHWWDVLFGSILGALGSYITVKYFSNWFIRDKSIRKPGIASHSSSFSKDGKT